MSTPSHPPQKLELRHLGTADLGSYRRLRLQALQECPAAFSATPAGERQLSDQQVLARFDGAGGQAMWGAISASGEVCASLGMYRELGEKLRHKAQLFAMYVAPEVRAQGVAQGLLQRAREHAEQLELRQLLLGCNADNAAALHLYKKAGFRRYGLAPQATFVNGQYFDEVLMVLTLTAVPAKPQAAAAPALQEPR